MLGELVLIEREPFKPIFWSTPHIGQGKCSSLVWLSPLQLASFGGDGMLICHELELPADADQATEDVRLEPIWAVDFQNPIERGGINDAWLWLCLNGERAVRMYPREFSFDAFSRRKT